MPLQILFLHTRRTPGFEIIQEWMKPTEQCQPPWLESPVLVEPLLPYEPRVEPVLGARLSSLGRKTAVPLHETAHPLIHRAPMCISSLLGRAEVSADAFDTTTPVVGKHSVRLRPFVQVADVRLALRPDETTVETEFHAMCHSSAD